MIEELRKAQKELFRFEQLPTYIVESEKEAFENYQKTGKVDMSIQKEWVEFLKESKAKGVKIIRARTIQDTPYYAFEKELYVQNIMAGEKIEFTEQTFDTPDFWIIDNTTVLVLEYDPNGKYVRFFKKEKKIEKFLAIKKELKL